ncbi:MAG: KTSC domain-containing protein [Steroidobacteraceae bacterium]
MKMQPVASSNIKAVGYEDGELRIEFTNGRTYAYTGSTAEHHHQEILKAESAGRYFAAHVRNDPELTTRPL